MLKGLIVHARYPYIAGIIIVIWFGSALLVAHDPSLSPTTTVILDALATTLIAPLGFSSPRR